MIIIDQSYIPVKSPAISECCAASSAAFWADVQDF